MDPIACEKRQELPEDAETEILGSAETEIKLFLTKCTLEIDQKEWANESVCKEAEALNDVLRYYKCKYLTKELRSKVAEKFIGLNFINIFNEFILFSLKTCPIIYRESDKYFIENIKTLRMLNSDNSSNELISNFTVLLYTQSILSTMMKVVIGCTDVNFTFCTVCVEGEFISTILRLLEIYLPVNNDEKMKVCFYNESLFTLR